LVIDARVIHVAEIDVVGLPRRSAALSRASARSGAIYRWTWSTDPQPTAPGWRNWE
jgi:hypothetical protein